MRFSASAGVMTGPSVSETAPVVAEKIQPVPKAVPARRTAAARHRRRDGLALNFSVESEGFQTVQPAANLTADSHQGRKILIVDDDRINLRILSGILKGEGYALAEANSGDAVVAAYEKFQPDLVLLDVVMPGISGYEACRELRRIHGDACAPIIFITAKSESDDVVEGLTAGGVDYLPKPFRRKEALARISTHLQNRILIEQLNKANQAKNRFLGMAAHDLRNPLAAIRGLAEFLSDGTVGALSAEQRDLVDHIHKASQAMLEVVNELLDVATIESGELRVTPQPHDLAKLIEKSVYLTNIEAAKKNTRIVFAPANATPGLAVWFVGPAMIASEALLNAESPEPVTPIACTWNVYDVVEPRPVNVQVRTVTFVHPSGGVTAGNEVTR